VKGNAENSLMLHSFIKESDVVSAAYKWINRYLGPFKI